MSIYSIKDILQETSVDDYVNKKSKDKKTKRTKKYAAGLAIPTPSVALAGNQLYDKNAESVQDALHSKSGQDVIKGLVATGKLGKAAANSTGEAIDKLHTQAVRGGVRYAEQLRGNAPTLGAAIQDKIS